MLMGEAGTVGLIDHDYKISIETFPHIAKRIQDMLNYDKANELAEKIIKNCIEQLQPETAEVKLLSQSMTLGIHEAALDLLELFLEKPYLVLEILDFPVHKEIAPFEPELFFKLLQIVEEKLLK